MILYLCAQSYTAQVDMIEITPEVVNILTANPNTTVDKAPPINPSHVFLGDSLISGVLPKKNPNMYAMMSLQIIMETGTKSLKNNKKYYKQYT